MKSLEELKVGNYYICNDYIFKIKEIHEQESSAAFLVEVSDWIGNSKDMKFTYELNNRNKLIFFGYGSLLNMEKVEGFDLSSFENEAIFKMATLMKTDGVFATPLKMNKARMDAVVLVMKLREERK